MNKNFFVLIATILLISNALAVNAAFGDTIISSVNNGFEKLLGIGKEFGDKTIAPVFIGKETAPERGGFKGFLDKYPNGVDVSSPGFRDNYLKPLPSVDFIKKPQDTKVSDIKLEEVNIDKFCEIYVEDDFTVKYKILVQPSEKNWIFKCDDQFCKDDQAPCEQNPCPQSGSGTCGTDCCNDAYASAKKLCSAQPDYDEQKNINPPKEESYGPPKKGAAGATEGVKPAEGAVGEMLKQLEQGKAESESKPCCQIVKDEIKDKINELNGEKGRCNFDKNCESYCLEGAKSIEATISFERTIGKIDINTIRVKAMETQTKANEDCKRRLQYCRESCLAANQKCRAGDRSCQRKAKEAVNDFYYFLPRVKEYVEQTPIAETQSCYDKSEGMNRHAMTAAQVGWLDEGQKYDWINGKHPILQDYGEQPIDYIPAENLLGESYIPYSENYLIGFRPLTPEVMADRIKKGGSDNPLQKAALIGNKDEWDNRKSYVSFPVRDVLKAFSQSDKDSDKKTSEYYAKNMPSSEALKAALGLTPGKTPPAETPGAEGAEAPAERQVKQPTRRELRGNPRALVEYRRSILNLKTNIKLEESKEISRRG